MEKTKVTQKYQTTIPKKIREILDIKPGEEVEWYIIQGKIILQASPKVKEPVKFLTSQTKLNLDAVKLVKETREEFK